MTKRRILILSGVTVFLSLLSLAPANAQRIKHDKQKEKQWRSMETGPWDFAPDWYYYFFHHKY